MAYTEEERAAARELYIAEGLTFDEVAERTGINATTIKKWSTEEGGWRRRRADLRANLEDIQQLTVRLRKKLLLAALKSLEGDNAEIDPQKMFAVSAIEGATAKLIKADLEAPEVPIEWEIKTPADAVAALEQAVERQVNRFLTEPGAISLKGIREMKDALDLVTDMKSKWAAEQKSGTQKGLSNEAAEVIRKKILGMDA